MKIKKIVANLNNYLLLGISLIIIIGTGVYYLYALNIVGIIISLIFVSGSFIIFSKSLFKQTEKTANTKLKLNKQDYIYPLIYSLLFLSSIIVLIGSQSNQALISPWSVVPSSFFILYALASLSLALIIFNKRISSRGKIVFISFHYFLSLIIAILVYKIGYGFDPFIHQATMELIDKRGFVSPKPPYYLGQYSLIIIIHRLTAISIYLLNKFLVPVLTAFFLPYSIYQFLKKQSNDRGLTSKLLTPVFLLILTFSPFILTTPQNLTYLFLFLLILIGLSQASPKWVLIISLATLAIHPLAGIPAIAWSAWLFYKKYQTRLKKTAKKIALSAIFSLNAFFLPLALLMTGSNSIKSISFNFNFLTEPLKNIFLNLSLAGQESWWLNFIYFFYDNLNLLILIIIIASVIYFYHQRSTIKKDQLILWQGLGVINLSLIVAYIIISQISFNKLIAYEQSSYASRILTIIVIFCLPFVIFSLNKLIKKILNQEKTIQIIWLILGVTLLTTALYLSYPRFDKYFNSRGYSTSQNDLQAVDLIAQETQKPYLVLADQQVSVAALKQLGFDHYYKTPDGQIYFYPIPTGGRLYQYYLTMVYKSPERKTMLAAMNLLNINEAYLVINKYWHRSGLIIGQAKLTANSWQTINNKVWIFKYSR